MKIFKFYFFAIVFFYSCTKIEKGNIKYDVTKIPVSFSKVKEEVFAKDIIDSIQYIKLENTQVQIGKIEKIIVDRDKIIIWDDSRKVVWVFNNKGKFIGCISRFGNGHDEYSSIYNISFTFPDKIHIIDGAASMIKTYNSKGQFIDLEKTDGNISDFLAYDDQKYLFYYYWTNPKNKFHLIAKNNNEQLVGFFNYTKPFLFIGNGGDFILKSRNSIYLRQPYNDTLYSVGLETVTAKYVFDFGENKYPVREINNATNLKDVNTIISGKQYEGNLSQVLLSDNHIISTIHQQQLIGNVKTSILVYNLKTKKLLTYHSLIHDSDEASIHYPIASYGDSFYAIQNSFELSEKIILRKKGNKSDYGLHSNPTLIKFNYK